MTCGLLIHTSSWVYVADIFPTRTRHFGLATASASQWLFNFVLSKVTPSMVSALGFKLFIMFATINIGGMATFALYVSPLDPSCCDSHYLYHRLIPETKGRSLEEMDIIFGSVKAEQRQADILKQERGTYHPWPGCSLRALTSSWHPQRSSKRARTCSLCGPTWRRYELVVTRGIRIVRAAAASIL